LKKFFSPFHQQQYNQLRNKVRATTRLDFKAFVNSITERLNQSSKPFGIGSIKSEHVAIPYLPSITKIMQTVTSDSTKANLCKQYFIFVFTKMDASSLPKINFPTIAGFTFDNLSVSLSDVCAELSALDTSKACGPDGICPYLPKEGATELAVPLVAILNISLADGALALDWISANITPVFSGVISILLTTTDQLV